MLVTLPMLIVLGLTPNSTIFVERRNALKHLATATLGLMSLPAWATNWHPTSLPTNLPAEQDQLLAELVETIIPTTDTPGAKTLGIQTFVQKVVADCFDKATQQTFANGLIATDALAQQSFGKAFVALDNDQRLQLVKQMATSQDADQKKFYNLVKGLAIRGYMTSEYVMTNLTHYQMAPGFYNGCVPVNPKTPTTK